MANPEHLEILEQGIKVWNEWILHEAKVQPELGTREPPLPVLLRIAEIAGVYADILIDDDLDLPKEIPCAPESIGIRRKHKMKGKYKQ